MTILKKLSNDIYYFPFSKEKDRPHLGYIKGERAALLVDAGNSPAHYNDFKKALDKEQLKTEDYCVLTHWHWDHTFGMCAFKTPVIAHTLTNKKLIEMGKWQWNEEALDKRVQEGVEIAFCAEHMRKEYSDISTIHIREADICFNDHYSLDLGNKIVEIIHVEASHGEDCVIVYVPVEKVVFLGDVYTEDYYHDLKIYKDKNLSLLQKLQDLDFEIGIHGHVAPQTKQEILAILIEMQTKAE